MKKEVKLVAHMEGSRKCFYDEEGRRYHTNVELNYPLPYWVIPGHKHGQSGSTFFYPTGRYINWGKTKYFNHCSLGERITLDIQLSKELLEQLESLIA